MPHPIAIDFITALGQDPVEMVHLCADLGVQAVSLALTPTVKVSDDAPGWSMREDSGLRRSVAAALAEREVRLLVCEGFLIHPQMDIANAAHDLDLVAELGAGAVNCVSIEHDEARGHAQFALLASLAHERGMRAFIEYMPFVAVDTLAKAIACVRQAGPGAAIVLDAMHFFRTGTAIADLAALDPALIGHAQLCDALAGLPPEQYMDAAKHDRLSPGEGDLPLGEFLAALPDGLPVGLEIPQRSRAQAGEDHRRRIENLIAAARGFSTELL
ncbi:sugar phosphate isomerase/epimerase [Novosphingobium sp. TH158]|uniref:sugar phosphate isomerase/epimerase family protein n=1 Tax=Novosphingobium sp. TH158 TaxID=2067455 RepID=UPI000C7B1643|nr:TIM barrel protein [Novosphingobium sp. TH158]PLK26208.1 sugar phosphate isomerase/epimerase [Novosphingobium sp. TH158]